MESNMSNVNITLTASPLKIIALCLAGLLTAAARPGASHAQSLPFEDKARYERGLEQKVDEVLLRLLGPNQAKVVVEILMDFNRMEKLEMKGEPVKNGSGGGLFKWQTGAEPETGEGYLLPGFPSPEGPAAAPENKTYNRQTIYPAAFVKKMTVSVIVNRELPAGEAENVRRVVSEMLSLDPARGDQLSVIKTQFAPFWRTVWYTPEGLKYIMLALMAIIAMGVVAVGFLKLAGAMSTMAKVQQNHQITMELGKGTEPGAEAGSPALGAAERPLLAALSKDQEAGSRDALRFEISREQVPFLVNMMAGEEPANVALVAAHLSREVRQDFLEKLPPQFSSEVLINMAKVRFVEPEIIATLKDELERRLSGATGGIDGTLEAIGGMSLRGKRVVMEEIRKKQPELAAEMRRQILMPEDLALFSDRELSLMAGAVNVEEWAAAMLELPAEARDKLKTQMAEKTWQMIEQSISYGVPSQERTEQAVERIMGAAETMIRDGRIANPAVGGQPLIGAEGQAAA